MSFNDDYVWGYHPEIGRAKEMGSPAWLGSRAIATPRMIDSVPGRSTLWAEDEAYRSVLLRLLDKPDLSGSSAWEVAQRNYRAFVEAGVIRGNLAREVKLYHSDVLKIVANTNASHGYLYVAAYLRPRPRNTVGMPPVSAQVRVDSRFVAPSGQEGVDLWSAKHPDDRRYLRVVGHVYKYAHPLLVAVPDAENIEGLAATFRHAGKGSFRRAKAECEEMFRRDVIEGERGGMEHGGYFLLCEGDYIMENGL